MFSSSVSFTLLTLFTSPERAASIQGDLTEEARTRGRIWFWSQVIRTTGALWRHGFMQSPLAILGLTLSGGATWVLMTVLLVAVELVSPYLGAPINLSGRSVLLLGALLTGIILGRAFPVRGMYASVVLAFASIPALSLILFAPQPYGGTGDLRLLFLALAVALLLMGSALSRRRVARKAG